MEPASAQHLLPYLAQIVWVMSAGNKLAIPTSQAKRASCVTMSADGPGPLGRTAGAALAQ